MIKRVQVVDLNERDMLWLLRATETSYTGVQPIQILEEAIGQYKQIWRYGSSDGIIVTQVLMHPAGRELYIFCMAGKGIFNNLVRVFSIFKDIAKEFECRWVGGLAARRGLTRQVERKLNATTPYTYCLVEVNDDES